MDSLNSSSLLFLLVGKENPWLPFLIMGLFLFQKWDTIYQKIRDATYFGKSILRFQTSTYYNSMTQSTIGDISPSFRAFLHHIQQFTSANKQTQHYTEFRIPYEESENIHIPANSKPFPITPSITAYFEIDYSFVNGQNRDGLTNTMAEMRRTNLTVTIVSAKNMTDIHSFMQTCLEEYNEHIKQQAKTQSWIVKPSIERDRYSEMFTPTRIPFLTNKSFDNLFFPEKDKLLHRLNMLNNSEHYMKLGLPQSLGILLYGEPGTGKTSTIKAIASYMKKNIILVPMNKIRTRQELEMVFYKDQCTGVKAEDRMYVFEEIDCNGWGSLLMDRRLKGDECISDTISESDLQDKDESVDKLAEIILAGSNKSIQESHQKKKKDEHDRLTLGCLLEIMDGIIEAPGRIIVMTTNRRHLLDPALTRPGRIDIEIEFKKLHPCDIAEIYKRWYNCELSAEEVDSIRKEAFTQAQLSQLLFQYEGRPDAFYAAVCAE